MQQPTRMQLVYLHIYTHTQTDCILTYANEMFIWIIFICTFLNNWFQNNLYQINYHVIIKFTIFFNTNLIVFALDRIYKHLFVCMWEAIIACVYVAPYTYTNILNIWSILHGNICICICKIKEFFFTNKTIDRTNKIPITSIKIIIITFVIIHFINKIQYNITLIIDHTYIINMYYINKNNVMQLKYFKWNYYISQSK